MSPQLNALKQHRSLILQFRQVGAQARRPGPLLRAVTGTARCPWGSPRLNIERQDLLPGSLRSAGVTSSGGGGPPFPTTGPFSSMAGRFGKVSPPGRCLREGARAHARGASACTYVRACVYTCAQVPSVQVCGCACRCLWTRLSHRWWRWHYMAFATFY